MEVEYQKMDRKEAGTKIVVPILIGLVVAGIWFIKNWQDAAGELQVENLDFALNVTEPLNSGRFEILRSSYYDRFWC